MVHIFQYSHHINRYLAIHDDKLCFTLAITRFHKDLDEIHQALKEFITYTRVATCLVLLEHMQLQMTYLNDYTWKEIPCVIRWALGKCSFSSEPT